MNLRLLQVSDFGDFRSAATLIRGGRRGRPPVGWSETPKASSAGHCDGFETSLGPLEGILVACGCRGARTGRPDDLHELNRLADASIIPPSIRNASREMGEQLLTLGRTWTWSAMELTPFLRTSSGSPRGWHHSRRN